MAVLGSRVILGMVRHSGLPCQLKHLPRGTWHPRGMPLQFTCQMGECLAPARDATTFRLAMGDCLAPARGATTFRLAMGECLAPARGATTFRLAMEDGPSTGVQPSMHSRP